MYGTGTSSYGYGYGDGADVGYSIGAARRVASCRAVWVSFRFIVSSLLSLNSEY
jgi:hypothetical protein